jgi:hypothetical protein
VGEPIIDDGDAAEWRPARVFAGGTLVVADDDPGEPRTCTARRQGTPPKVPSRML